MPARLSDILARLETGWLSLGDTGELRELHLLLSLGVNSVRKPLLTYACTRTKSISDPQPRLRPEPCVMGVTIISTTLALVKCRRVYRTLRNGTV